MTIDSVVQITAISFLVVLVGAFATWILTPEITEDMPASELSGIFAALTIGFTAFMAVLGDNERLRDEVLDAVDDALPGLIDTGDGGLVPHRLLLLDVEDGRIAQVHAFGAETVGRG